MLNNKDGTLEGSLLRTSSSTLGLKAGDRSRSRSISSGSVAGPSTKRSRVRIVATKPPWSRDESASSDDDEPTHHHSPTSLSTIPRTPNASQLARTPSKTRGPHPESLPNWWLLGGKGKRTQPRPRMHPLPSTYNLGEPSHPQVGEQRGILNENLRLELPAPLPPAPFTVAQVQTPGWDIPWSPTGPKYNPALQQQQPAQLHKESSIHMSQETASNRPGTSLSRKNRKKTFRKFILNNTYVPLLFRVMNLAFTTSALAVAVRIRRIEIRHQVTGAVGSSPNLVIIFAPLTIVHVVWAIYLEYWGRPLGLWRTSAKLGYTLSETLFICAWSAALSLCFDNIFTSPLQCTPTSSTKWFSDLPPQPNPLTGSIGRSNDGPTDQICDSQGALIALVTVGLFSYCANLVISLFRIFEKVKYHSHSLREP